MIEWARGQFHEPAARAAFTRLQSFQPEGSQWVIRPPTEPYGSAFIDTGYLTHDRFVTAERKLGQILSEQYELISRIAGQDAPWFKVHGDPTGAKKRLDDLVFGAADARMRWDAAMASSSTFPELPPDPNPGGNIGSAQRGGIVSGQGSGDIMPFLLEPSELIVPRSYRDEVLARAATRDDESADDVTIENINVHVTVTGDELKFDRELWRQQAGEIRRAVYSELRNLRDRDSHNPYR